MIKFSISKHKQLSELNNKDIYVLWKESDYGCRGIYQGSKKNCKIKLKELKYAEVK